MVIAPDWLETGLDAGRSCAALVSRDGTPVFESDAFRSALLANSIDCDLVEQVWTHRAPAIGSAVAPNTASDSAPDAFFAYAPAAITAGWVLSDDVRAAALRFPGAVIVIAATPPSRSDGLSLACRMFGLTALQTRIVIALIEGGSTRAAAIRANVSYHTAREAIAEAMTRMAVTKASTLVEAVTLMAFGITPGATTIDMLCDQFGLTPRQLVIASAIANGASREEAALECGLSSAVVKKELDRIFITLGVSSATALARLIAEARILSMLMGHARMIVYRDLAEPLTWVTRLDGSRIACSDYGPAGAPPVLILHSSMTSRPVGGALVDALHKRGFRPFSIDRPGFGLSDDCPIGSGPHAAFVAAAEDIATVCAEFGFDEVALIGRGAAQIALEAMRATPDLIAVALLVNPDPHTSASSRRWGPLGAVKEAFFRHPAAIRVMSSMLASYCTPLRICAAMKRVTRGSPPDEAVAADPRHMADYYRAVRMFGAHRLTGYRREQQAFTHGVPPWPFRGSVPVHVLIGEFDVLHDPAEVELYWRDILPHAVFERVAGAGRLMTFSHADMVADRLVDLLAERRTPQMGMLTAELRS